MAARNKRSAEAPEQKTASVEQNSLSIEQNSLSIEQTTAPAAMPGLETHEEKAMQNSIQNGDTMEYTPADDVAGGDLVVFTNMVAVAVTDIPAGATGALAAVGVFELPKGNLAFAQGQVVYAAADGRLTADGSGGGIRAGVVWAEAAAGDAVVAVKINV